MNSQSASARLWRCLVVDDEPLAREVIRRYISRVPSLVFSGEASNAIEAMELLKNNEIDLIFLDIQMPEILGTELIRILKNPPAVIITSAFQEYALEGYELDVVDYLLKPVKFERFLKSVAKVFRHDGDGLQHTIQTESDEPASEPFLYFRTDRKTVKVMLDEIQYIEGMGNYVKIFLEKSVVITKNSMTTVEAMLPEKLFLRIHRSFIVSRQKIKAFASDSVELNRISLPIGKLYKAQVIKAIANNR